jgi:hypothetical protein
MSAQIKTPRALSALNEKSGKDAHTKGNRKTDLAHDIEENAHHKARFKSRFFY